MEKTTFIPPTDFIYDQRAKGWELRADVPLEGNPTLELAEFLKKDESYVKGEVMLERATERGNMAGQRHAERMFAMASQIPESWRAFVLVFPGTVWWAQSGDLSVPYLFWDGSKWHLHWGRLEIGWYWNGRLVSLK